MLLSLQLFEHFVDKQHISMLNKGQKSFIQVIRYSSITEIDGFSEFIV